MTDATEAAGRTLHDHLAAVAERDHVPGIAYGLVHRGSLTAAGGVGTIAIGDDAVPTATTPSRIASMTKSFTAAGVLLLRDEHGLSLDVPVASIVPELGALAAPTADSPAVTVRHLLSMGSGLPEDNAWADRHLQVSREDVDSMFARGATFARAPGVAYEYSNLG
jgi:CubicO group peptidase (beta-lactamase class C family)